MGILTGKRVLITGGSMGIGLACARACLVSGASVFICARTHGPLEKAVATLKAEGFSSIDGCPVDISDPCQVDSLFNKVFEQMGGLEGLIHSAAILGPIGPATETDPAEWFDAIRINLFGTFLVARRACQLMKSQGGGRLVLLSGGGAATPLPNYTAYACGKVGVVRFTETLAQEMAPFGIEINCLAPGFVITRIHERTLAAGERAGKSYLQQTKHQIESGGVPAEVAARAAVFLISDRAKGISGRLAAAPYDDWQNWPRHLTEFQASDIFTLRRIVPRDRGMDWQ